MHVVDLHYTAFVAVDVTMCCRRCVVRPHYGLSGGRPVYCASHKKSSMVHLLKESMTREKEATAR